MAACRLLVSGDQYHAMRSECFCRGRMPGSKLKKRDWKSLLLIVLVVDSNSITFVIVREVIIVLCNEEEESVEHLLCKCVAKENIRRRILMNCTPDPSYFNNINLSRLLNYIKKLEV